MLGASDAVLDRTSDGILEVSAFLLSLGPTDGETLGTSSPSRKFKRRDPLQLLPPPIISP